MTDLFLKEQLLFEAIPKTEAVEQDSTSSLQPTTTKQGKQPPADKKKLYKPTELDDEILQYVMEYHLLTAWQLVNLHYSKGSKTLACSKLQILAGKCQATPCKTYLYRDSLPKKSAGNPTYYYVLATEGIKYLRNNGYRALKRRFRPSEVSELSYLYKLHALNVNDVLIAGRNLPKYQPDIYLFSFLHDLDLQKTPVSIEFNRRSKNGSGNAITQEKVRLVPDGILDFRLKIQASEKKERRRVIFLEIDRGTRTNIEAFKKKLLAYIYYLKQGGPFEAQFGRVNKRIAYIVTCGGENRLTTIRKWCEDVLSDQELEEEYNLFRFTTLSQVVDVKTGHHREELHLDPTIFVSPVWYTAMF